MRPAHVSMKLFAEEVRFFGIPEDKLIELQIMEGYLQDNDEDQEVRIYMPESVLLTGIIRQSS